MKNISLKTILAYSIASLGSGVFWAFNNADLPLYLNQWTQNAIIIGLLSSTRSFEGSIVQPIVGAWSDIVWTPLGRRKPFIAVGIVLSALIMTLIPSARTLVMVAAGIILFSFFFNVALDPYTALLGDLFPVHHRSRVSGIATLFNMGGQVLVLGLGGLLWRNGIPEESFYFVALFLLISFGITFFGIKETEAVNETRQKVPLKQYLSELLAYTEAMKFYGVQFLFWFGINAVTPFLTLFAVKSIGVDEGQAQIMFMILVVSTAGAAVPVGMLGDRFGNKRMLSLGLLTFLLASVAGILVVDVSHLGVVLVIAGVGNAATTVLAYPLLTQLVPQDKLGVFTGLNASFVSIAIPISVLVSGTLINLVGYRSIFALLAVALLIALLLLRSVKVSHDSNHDICEAVS